MSVARLPPGFAAIMLNTMRRSKERQVSAERIYDALVTRAREPIFFARFDVPDTLDGRFDLLTVHAWMALACVKAEPRLSQVLVDMVFAGFEAALRDLGVGDLGLGRRMKQLADAFFGRLEGYDAAEGDLAALEDALARNLYRGARPEQLGQMAAYVLRASAAIAKWKSDRPDFGPLPGEE